MMQRIQSEELKIQQIISNHLDSGQHRYMEAKKLRLDDTVIGQ